ncbi:MAG: maleylpyruvate isomerase N-terminal domain-containing protein [Planctomycetota bacterium]
MTDKTGKREFMKIVRSGRKRWEDFLSEADPERLESPGYCGEWSLKDTVAHVTWYEREIVELLSSKTFSGSPLWALDPHERNARIFEEVRDSSLEEVLRDSGAVFSELWNGLSNIEDEDLNDPGRFPGMPDELRPWEIIAGNTYEHYEGHLPRGK